MKRQPNGYTIIEVMIFLLVSTALLTSVMAMISGRAERTRFTQSVERVDNDIQDILNDVSTGFYPTTGNFRCQSGAGGTVTFTAGSAEQGTNQGCVFLGKALRFGVGSDRTKYDVYTMVGAKTGTGLGDSFVELLGSRSRANPATQNPGIVDQYNGLADVEIVKTVSLADPSRNLTGIALVSEFSQTSALTNKTSGNAAKVALYEVIGDFEANAGKPEPAMQLATGGVMLCMQQGSGGRKGAIIIGAGGRQLGSEVKIDEWPAGCPT